MCQVELSSATVHIAALSAPEQRVLGCLIEKRWTTPDQYPLSVNALRLACNQSTKPHPDTALAVLAVRLLRAPQPPGELKGRTERMHRFASLEEVDAVLIALGGERDYVQRLDRRPGQKEDRFAQLLGG